MTKTTSAQVEFEALDKEYRAYVDKLRTEWNTTNRMHSKNVYETMRPEERKEVHARIAMWGRYITPLAEAWWKERGRSVIWPADNSEPMKVHKLEKA